MTAIYRTSQNAFNQYPVPFEASRSRPYGNSLQNSKPGIQIAEKNYGPKAQFKRAIDKKAANTRDATVQYTQGSSDQPQKRQEREVIPDNDGESPIDQRDTFPVSLKSEPQKRQEREVNPDNDGESPIDENEKFSVSLKSEASVAVCLLIRRGSSLDGQSLELPKQAMEIEANDSQQALLFIEDNPDQDDIVKDDCKKCHDVPQRAAEVEKGLLDKEKPQTESESSRGCKRLTLILSLAALLTCFAVLLYVIVVLATQFTPRDHEKQVQFMSAGGNQTSFQEVCLDCQRLVKNPYSQHRHDPVVEGLTQRKEGNVLKCCAENRVQMSAMLKAVGRRQDTIKDVFPAAVKEMQKSSTVSVHKQMISETWNSLTGYNVVKFDPSNNQGLGEHSRGAAVLEDGIVIMKTGLYYIYSNVFYNVNVTGKAALNQTWSSHAHRTSPQRNTRTGILLTAVHTLCYNCTRDLITSFTGGVFTLQSGDIIQLARLPELQTAPPRFQ